MRWVKSEGFTGPDRRTRAPELKFGERRQRSSVVDAPSLSAGLRSLRVAAQAANTPRGVAAFLDRASAIATLAHGSGSPEIGKALEALVRRVGAEPGRDWQQVLGEELAAMSAGS